MSDRLKAKSFTRRSQALMDLAKGLAFYSDDPNAQSLFDETSELSPDLKELEMLWEDAVTHFTYKLEHKR